MIRYVHPGFFPIPDPGVKKTLDPGSASAKLVFIIEMENISRDSTFGDFVSILTEGSMQDVTVSKLHSAKV
jgi:hypothetical protein